MPSHLHLRTQTLFQQICNQQPAYGPDMQLGFHLTIVCVPGDMNTTQWICIWYRIYLQLGTVL